MTVVLIVDVVMTNDNDSIDDSDDIVLLTKNWYWPLVITVLLYWIIID